MNVDFDGVHSQFRLLLYAPESIRKIYGIRQAHCDNDNMNGRLRNENK